MRASAFLFFLSKSLLSRTSSPYEPSKVTLAFVTDFILLLLLASEGTIMNSRQRSKPSRDAVINKNLPGTWVIDLGVSTRSTIVVSADGNYKCQITGLPSGELIKLEGTMQVKDGFLIDTLTYSSRITLGKPSVGRDRIIRANEHEMVVETDNWDAVYRKITK